MEDANTRKGRLLAVSSLYHPFGMVGPVTLVVKGVLQMTCKLKLGWDDELPGELFEAWEQRKANLFDLEGIKVPRC